MNQGELKIDYTGQSSAIPKSNAVFGIEPMLDLKL